MRQKIGILLLALLLLLPLGNVIQAAQSAAVEGHAEKENLIVTAEERAQQQILLEAAEAESGDGSGVSAGRVLLMVLVIPCVVSGVVCLALKAQMNSVHKGTDAAAYVTSKGLALRKKSDTFTHKTQTRRKIEKKS